MPTGFVADILRRVPATMVMPAPLVALFRWLEATGATALRPSGGSRVARRCSC